MLLCRCDMGVYAVYARAFVNAARFGPFLSTKIIPSLLFLRARERLNRIPRSEGALKNEQSAHAHCPLASSGRNSTRAVRAICWRPRTAETIVHRARLRMSNVAAKSPHLSSILMRKLVREHGVRYYAADPCTHTHTHTTHTTHTHTHTCKHADKRQRNATHTHNTQCTRARTHSWPQTPQHTQTDLRTSCRDASVAQPREAQAHAKVPPPPPQQISLVLHHSSSRRRVHMPGGDRGVGKLGLGFRV